MYICWWTSNFHTWSLVFYQQGKFIPQWESSGRNLFCMLCWIWQMKWEDMKEFISKFCSISLSGKCRALQSIPKLSVQVDKETLKRLPSLKLKSPYIFSWTHTLHTCWYAYYLFKLGTCERAHSTTNSNDWRRFKWKILRYTRAPQIAAKWDPTGSDKCWFCGPVQSGAMTRGMDLMHSRRFVSKRYWNNWRSFSLVCWWQRQSVFTANPIWFITSKWLKPWTPNVHSESFWLWRFVSCMKCKESQTFTTWKLKRWMSAMSLWLRYYNTSRACFIYLFIRISFWMDLQVHVVCCLLCVKQTEWPLTRNPLRHNNYFRSLGSVCAVKK